MVKILYMWCKYNRIYYVAHIL